jgi:hypothetical protein
MSSQVAEQKVETKRYGVQYPVSAYTWPSDARIHQVAFDDEYIHVDLIDGRRISIPLWWIPTLHNARREELEKYEINRTRTMIVWDPTKCAINDELRIADYMGPGPASEADRPAE